METYTIGSNRTFNINFNYSADLADRLEELFNTKIIKNIKILNKRKEVVYETTIYTTLNSMISNFNTNIEEPLIILEFVKKADDN